MPQDVPTLFDALDLARHGDRPALIGPDRVLTRRRLQSVVGERRRELDLAPRSVVVLAGSNSIEWIVNLLALLAERHVPLLAGDHVGRLVDAWAPQAVIRSDRAGWTIDHLDTAPNAPIHPDLAMLMSTSGSTGSPKLVRLTTENLVSNASSIAEYQSLTPGDRGITTLPMHYSFGLSILDSHLVAGAGVVVTDTSVVDPCFARAMSDHQVTNVAGVPYTFELLEQAGADRIAVPSLRFLAQAGGRMDAAATVAWSARAEHWGAEWFSMYGQTEATARIAYLPPAMARRHAGSIGRAIPGGTMTIEPVAGRPGDDVGDGVGEIVYRGPNVMLGYAIEPRDLARGRDVGELRTGDLGRLDPTSGLVEIVGRRSRHVKPFGLRIDLDDVERRLGADTAGCTVVGDDEIIVAAGAHLPPDRVVADLRQITGLPASRIFALPIDPPRTPSGKIDAAELLRVARDPQPSDRAGSSGDPTSPAGSHRVVALQQVYAGVFDREHIAMHESFVGLGGDSLSYVECSIRVEQVLGRLPSDWHLRPISELAASEQSAQRLARVDTTVVLRAIGILAVVSTHMRFHHVPGGAHLLLGVVGYNLARFMMPIESTRHRVVAGMRTVGRVAVPTMLWTAALMTTGQYTWSTLSLFNNYVGPRSHAGNHWHFWFIEVFVHLVTITTLLFAIPAVRRADRRWPYGFPLVVLAVAITFRLGWADMGDWYNLRFRTHAVAWFFVLGWLVQRSSSFRQRVVTTVICLASAPGVFQNPRREFFIAFGLVLLVWCREVALPRVAVRPVATLAAASMWILISHFVIWPPLRSWFIIEVAYPLTVLTSVGVWWIVTNGPALLLSRVPVRGRRRTTSIAANPAVSLL